MAAAQRPEPARPMRADARRNWELLVDTARDVFAEKGAEAPMDEIAKRAGVGAGTLYRHFPNRDALIEAVYIDEIEALVRRAHDLLAEHPPFDALVEWIGEQVRWINHRRGLAASLKSAMRPDSDAMKQCRDRIHEAAALLVNAGHEAGTVRSDIEPYDVVRLGHGLAVASEFGDAGDQARMLTVLAAGLRPVD